MTWNGKSASLTLTPSKQARGASASTLKPWLSLQFTSITYSNLSISPSYGTE